MWIRIKKSSVKFFVIYTVSGCQGARITSFPCTAVRGATIYITSLKIFVNENCEVFQKTFKSTRPGACAPQDMETSSQILLHIYVRGTENIRSKPYIYIVSTQTALNRTYKRKRLY